MQLGQQHATESGPRAAGNAQGVVLILAATLAVMGVLVISPILPQLMRRYADVPGIAFLGPVVLTAPAICIALFSPVAGWLADRVGRRRLLIAAMVFYAPLGAAPMVLDSIWAILASRIGVGLAEAVIMTASTTLIGDYFSGPRRDTWLAWQVGVSAISSVALLLIGGLLGSIDWRAPFAVYLTAWALAIATLLLTWQPPRGSNQASGIIAPKMAFPIRQMAVIYGATLLGGMIFYIVPVQLSLVLGELGVTNPAVIGGSAAFGALVVPLGSVIFRRLSKIDAGVMLSGAFTLAGIGLLIMGVSRDFKLTMAGVLINQLGCGVILPTLLAWAMRSLPAAWRGRGVGLWTASMFIGQFLSPLALTFAAKALGAVGPAVVLAGVLALGGGLAAGAAAIVSGRRDKTASNGRPAPIEGDLA